MKKVKRGKKGEKVKKGRGIKGNKGKKVVDNKRKFVTEHEKRTKGKIECGMDKKFDRMRKLKSM